MLSPPLSAPVPVSFETPLVTIVGGLTVVNILSKFNVCVIGSSPDDVTVIVPETVNVLGLAIVKAVPRSKFCALSTTSAPVVLS
jgi:hypothetical protein